MKNVSVHRAAIYFFSLVALTLSSGELHAQDEVPEKAEEVCPLLPGQKIPELSLKDIDGQEFSLSQQPVVMIFYRGGW